MFPPTYGLLKLAQQFEEPRSREQPVRLLAEPSKLWVTIPAELSHDIGSVLAFVDTVLALDPLREPAGALGPAT